VGQVENRQEHAIQGLSRGAAVKPPREVLDDGGNRVVEAFELGALLRMDAAACEILGPIGGKQAAVGGARGLLCRPPASGKPVPNLVPNTPVLSATEDNSEQEDVPSWAQSNGCARR
jgi:hypothetical protein